MAILDRYNAMRNYNEAIYATSKDNLVNMLQNAIKNRTLPSVQLNAATQFIDSKDYSYASFARKIPITDKKEIFSDKELLRQALRTINQSVTIIPSAGSSGSQTTAFRMTTASASNEQTKVTQKIFENLRLDPKRTLLIKAYPAHMPTPPRINVLELGVRPELLPGLLDHFYEEYESIAIVALPQFVTYCIQHGYIQRKHAPKLYFLLGGANFPPAYPVFLSTKLGYEPKEVNRKVFSMLGVAEVGLGIGVFTEDLHLIRKKYSNPLAMPFYLNQDQFLVEFVDRKLVITPLSVERTIPLLRYWSGDYGAWSENQNKLFFVDPINIRDDGFLPARIENAILESKILNKFLTGVFKIGQKIISIETLTSPEEVPCEEILGEFKRSIPETKDFNLRFVHCLERQQTLTFNPIKKVSFYE